MRNPSLVFVAADPERWRREGPLAVLVGASERSQMSRRRRLPVQVIAAERVDVRVRDWSDARDRGFVGDDVGRGRVEVA